MSSDRNRGNPLNQLRHEQPETLVDEWQRINRDDSQYARSLINDPQLDFPVLFLLRDQFDTRSEDLNKRTQIALAHIRNVLHGADLGMDNTMSFAHQHDQVVGSMFWILQTGWKTIVSTDYTQVIDQTAINLLHTFHENWIKEMVDLIFYRYKNKSQRHYLISALWETADPICLIYISNYLLSDQSVESSYARRMLTFIPEVRHATDNHAALLAFESWFEDNAHYLVYTGETNDAVPGGRPFRIHYSAKYLGKTVSPSSGEPIQTLMQTERKRYDDFIKLPIRVQISLSTFSSLLRKQQPKIWRSWINQPINEQLEVMKRPAHGGDRL
ncbi:hypothetical protein ACFP7A_10210 [Sporolactobacillus kofuensis]|uniref:DUF2515 domain-containing protein n=1 Tax=Sporolactobacillus kofuensis TaxID=269672 RepID=A0ABW1WF21_9BACL|nr:hypothetical protein [Sporolactobacillus kofuensis]MCO7176248.1 hypothetical protein [Sporolactobacillus kofuensis]